jgi:hypothetical protein
MLAWEEERELLYGRRCEGRKQTSDDHRLELARKQNFKTISYLFNSSEDINSVTRILQQAVHGTNPHYTSHAALNPISHMDY